MSNYLRREYHKIEKKKKDHLEKQKGTMKTKQTFCPEPNECLYLQKIDV